MEDHVVTPVGIFREVYTKGSLTDRWMFQCPGCGIWHYLEMNQWEGLAPLDHTESTLGRAGLNCTYNETHNYADILGALLGREP